LPKRILGSKFFYIRGEEMFDETIGKKREDIFRKTAKKVFVEASISNTAPYPDSARPGSNTRMVLWLCRESLLPRQSKSRWDFDGAEVGIGDV